MNSNSPWLNSYPADVPATINPDEFPNLVDFFDDCLTKYAANNAFVSMGKNLSYAELDQKSRDFAAYLQQKLKLKKGERIALMMPNVLQYPIALIGAIRAGLVVVNVNPLYTPRELKHQLRDSGASAIVAVTNFGNNLQQVIDETSIKHVILTHIGDQLAPHKRTLVNFAVKYVKKMVPKYHLPEAISMRRALTQGKRCDYQKPELNGEDMAFLQYTGGTTGVAKGAVLTHRNIISNVLQVHAHFSPRLLGDKEHAVTPLPLYHIFANTVSMMMFMHLGGNNLLIANPRDMKSFVNDLSKYPFTMMFGLNTLFNGLLNNPGFKALDFSRCRFTIAGGMATQQHIAEEWQKLTGMTVVEGYGLTESSPVVAGGIHTQQSFVPNIGVPLPSTEMRVVDAQDQELPIGESGELQVRGPQVMQGYWKNQLETDAAINPEGWLKTGDIGFMDEKGYFTINDRKKDMIIVSGFNVFPSELEEIATLHPLVLEAAAIGVPDEVTGEQIKLFVVVKGELSSEDLKAHCRKYVTGYKVPRLYEFRDELPKSPVGKILRKDLR